MAGMINPIYQRAAGVIPRFTVSETEKILGSFNNSYRSGNVNGHEGMNACYRVRYDCPKCGQYESLTAKKPENIEPFCLYCASKYVSIDGCDGWTNRTLPFVGEPIQNFLAHRPLVNQQKPQRKKLTCQWCGKEFEMPGRKKEQRTCSPRCGSERYRHMKAMMKLGIEAKQ